MWIPVLLVVSSFEPKIVICCENTVFLVKPVFRLFFRAFLRIFQEPHNILKKKIGLFQMKQRQKTYQNNFIFYLEKIRGIKLTFFGQNDCFQHEFFSEKLDQGGLYANAWGILISNSDSLLSEKKFSGFVSPKSLMNKKSGVQNSILKTASSMSLARRNTIANTDSSK